MVLGFLNFAFAQLGGKDFSLFPKKHPDIVSAYRQQLAYAARLLVDAHGEAGDLEHAAEFYEDLRLFASHKEREVIALWGRGTYDLFYAYLTHSNLPLARSMYDQLVETSSTHPACVPTRARAVAAFALIQACGKNGDQPAAEIARDSRHFLRLEETKSALIASYGEEATKDFYNLIERLLTP